MKEREEEIREAADELRRISRRAWKRPAYFALTLIGAAYSANTGKPIGAILSGLAALLSPPGSEAHADAYSYLFSATERFSY